MNLQLESPFLVIDAFSKIYSFDIVRREHKVDVTSQQIALLPIRESEYMSEQFLRTEVQEMYAKERAKGISQCV